MAETKDRVLAFLEAMKGVKSVLLLTHLNPDPDALAAAFGLKHFLAHTLDIKSTIGYSGIIGRAENKSMVSLLRIKPITLSRLKNRKFNRVVLCDTQSVDKQPFHFNGKVVDGVFDHHPSYRRKTHGKFADIRTQYGSTSTIVTEYLQEMNVPPDARVATALYYGIKTDISDLARKKSDADLAAMRLLFPKISVRWLYRIENPRHRADYFRAFGEAIHKARIYKDAVVVNVGPVGQADYVAELADFLLRLEGLRWSFCTGCDNGKLVFSIRSLSRAKEAGLIAHRLTLGKNGSGGGHKRSAAGRIDLSSLPPDKQEAACASLVLRFLKEIGRDEVACRPIAEFGAALGGKQEGIVLKPNGHP